MKYKTYLVTNKSDDYGNCRIEIVQTTLKNAKEYYSYKLIDEEDVKILSKYFHIVSYEEESEREERYY